MTATPRELVFRIDAVHAQLADAVRTIHGIAADIPHDNRLRRASADSAATFARQAMRSLENLTQLLPEVRP